MTYYNAGTNSALGLRSITLYDLDSSLKRVFISLIMLTVGVNNLNPTFFLDGSYESSYTFFGIGNVANS